MDEAHHLEVRNVAHNKQEASCRCERPYQLTDKGCHAEVKDMTVSRVTVVLSMGSCLHI